MRFYTPQYCNQHRERIVSYGESGRSAFIRFYMEKSNVCVFSLIVQFDIVNSI
jgi:hypothetical protein